MVSPTVKVVGKVSPITSIQFYFLLLSYFLYLKIIIIIIVVVPLTRVDFKKEWCKWDVADWTYLIN